MRRLQCNQVSFLLASIVLQLIASELYHGADCLELKKLKIHGIVEPLLNKLKKSDLGGSSFSKIGEIFSSLSEKTVGLLESFAKNGNGIKPETQSSKGDILKSLKETIFTDSQTESSTEVNCEDDSELFSNSEDDTEPPEEEETVDTTPQPKCESRISSENRNSAIVSVLKNLKFMFNIPIKIVHPKPSKKRQDPDACYTSNCYEPFT